MASESYRGIVQKGTVQLLDGASLTDGTQVLITPVASKPGTASAVLAAMDAPPHLPPAWVDDLEQQIAQGQLPPSRDNPFEELNGDPKGS
jgi:hypothetical protein